jgi:hypothetical protein
MRKLLFLAVLGGVAYGLRKLYEDTYRQSGHGRDLEGQGERAFRRQKIVADLARDEESALVDDRLDEALRDTFPASDPPAVGPHR